MKIDHLALWVRDLEAMKAFYVNFFEAQSNEKYHNPKKEFSSYFLSFPGSDARLELMHNPLTADRYKDDWADQSAPRLGYIHIAMSVGSRELVDSKTQELREAGYSVLGEPRTTGDGYYESVVADPEGNLVEITI